MSELACPQCGSTDLVMQDVEVAVMERWPTSMSRSRFVFECPQGHRVDGDWGQWGDV